MPYLCSLYRVVSLCQHRLACGTERKTARVLSVLKASRVGDPLQGRVGPDDPFDPIPASLGSRTLTPSSDFNLPVDVGNGEVDPLRCEGENGEESERCGGENTPTLGVAAPIHRALHVGSPRDLWPCVLPKWQFNVYVNVGSPHSQ